jgi:hypothetical protein
VLLKKFKKIYIDANRLVGNSRYIYSIPSPFNYFIQPDPDQILRVCVGLGFKRSRLQYVYSILRGKDLETGDISEQRRYSSSPESVMESDLAKLRPIKSTSEFIGTLDQIIKDTLTKDYWNITLVNSLETSSARTPVLFAYYAALNLLDAKVLFSKLKVSELLDPAIKAKKSALERHHLFPKAYLKKLGITEIRQTNQLANYALVEWVDNINISGIPPATYFLEFVEKYQHKSDELNQMMQWHALPFGWDSMDYADFLVHRRKLIAQIICKGFEKLV